MYHNFTHKLKSVLTVCQMESRRTSAAANESSPLSSYYTIAATILRGKKKFKHRFKCNKSSVRSQRLVNEEELSDSLLSINGKPTERQRFSQNGTSVFLKRQSRRVSNIDILL